MLAWMLCFLLGRGDVNTRCCDVIEVSHVVDREGRVTFVQLIAWKLHPEDGQYHAHGWRMIHPHEWPMQHGSKWIVYGEAGVKIEAPMMRVSWSNVDPESEDRRRFWKGDCPNLFERGKRMERNNND
jgi:hypothetical protein